MNKDKSSISRKIYFDTTIHLESVKDCISGKNEQQVIIVGDYTPMTSNRKRGRIKRKGTILKRMADLFKQREGGGALKGLQDKRVVELSRSSLVGSSLVDSKPDINSIIHF